MTALYVPNSNGAPFIIAWLDVALIALPVVVIVSAGLLVKPRQNLLGMGILAGFLAWGASIAASSIILFIGGMAAALLGQVGHFELLFPWISWCFIAAIEIGVIATALRSEYSASP